MLFVFGPALIPTGLEVGQGIVQQEVHYYLQVLQ